MGNVEGGKRALIIFYLFLFNFINHNSYSSMNHNRQVCYFHQPFYERHTNNSTDAIINQILSIPNKKFMYHIKSQIDSIESSRDIDNIIQFFTIAIYIRPHLTNHSHCFINKLDNHLKGKKISMTDAQINALDNIIFRQQQFHIYREMLTIRCAKDFNKYNVEFPI